MASRPCRSAISGEGKIGRGGGRRVTGVVVLQEDVHESEHWVAGEYPGEANIELEERTR